MKKNATLAVVIVAFLVMTGVCIYQNRVIEDQRGVIRKLFEDGFATNTKPKLLNPDDYTPPEGDQ